MSTVRIQLRRGTAAEWTSANTVLSAGEVGFETDTGKFKIGNGSTAWTSLTYASILPSDLSELSQDAVNSAIVAGTGLDKTYDDGSNTITLDIDSTVATKTYADSAVSTHSSDTTSVHGIADTSEIAVKNAANIFTDENSFVGGFAAANPTMSGTARANNLIVDGNLTVQGTTTTVNTANVSLVDNIIYLNEALEYNITNAVGNGTEITYTIDGTHDITTAMFAKVSGITPSELNIAEYSQVLSVGTHTITIANTSTSTYVSGGTIYAKADVNPDIGLVAAYSIDGSYAHTGIVRDATNGKFKFFEGYQAEPGQTINFSQATLSDIVAANATLSSADIGSVSNSELQYLHGVTSSVQTQLNNIDTEIINHSSDTISVHGISNTANLVYQTDLSSHASDTTLIHGISDTANLVYQEHLTSHASDTTSVHGISDTAELATKTYANDAVSTHASDTTSVHGIADTAALATKTYADDAVSTHNSDTTNVHGISDTANLVYQTDLSNHASDTTSIHGISDTANLVYQSSFSTHTDATTSVHGIADVAALATKTYADGAVSTHEADTTTHGVTGTIVGTTDTQTLTGKTIALGSNTISGTLAEFNTALSGADFATIAGTETLTGKTISYVDNTITINTANISDITATATELNYVDGVTSAIQTQLDSKLPKSGGTMTGDLILNADPTQALGAATKQYVDTLAAQGLRVKDGVDVATNATLASISGGTITYNNGTSGVGATLTTTGSFATIDGLGLSGFTEPIRVLVKNEATAANNGIYILANSSATVMTRDVWFDSDADIDAGDFVFVVGGNQGGTGWVQTATVNTVGTDNVTFVQFSGAGTIVAGTNISVSGMTVSAVSNPTFSGLITASSGIAFSDGTQTKIGVPSITTISAKTDSYTLSSLTERDTIIEINKATATTLTVPPDGTVNYPVGTTLDIIQTGAGQVTIAAGSGVTVNATPGLKLRTQWSSCTLLKRAANTWLVYGDLSA